MKKKTIAVFTGTRAEFGLLQPLLCAIAASETLTYQLIVGGAHLDARFGNSLGEIEQSGFTVHARVDTGPLDNSLVGTAHAIGTGIMLASKVLQTLNPDILLVYGDRFETFAVVIAASQMGIPVAHVEGGDLTEGGALDDSVRHAISKLSHIHFTTNEQATNRLLGMGEEPWRVHTVGLPSIDSIKRSDYATPEQLIQRYGIDPTRPIILFTQHSIATEIDEASDQIRISLKALRSCLQNGYQVFMTYPNNDAGGIIILTEMSEFYRNHKDGNLFFEPSLGRFNYHGILALAKSGKVVCVGNSSSGLKETPEFFCPAVNIGLRQKGRLKASNVIDAEHNEHAIFNAIQKCLTAEFKQICLTSSNPYGDGTASTKVVDILTQTTLGKQLIQKAMKLEGRKKDGWYQ